MTVIAWDGKTLAADKRFTSQGLVYTVTKIHRLGELLLGASGDAASAAEAIDWIRRGRRHGDFPERLRSKDCYVDLIVIDNGKILEYENSPFPTEIEDTIMAIGSGRDFALSAMYLGKTAKEAVEIACLFDSGCGNGVDVLTVEPTV